MVVCQFFLENRCKFGENCRNEHAHGAAQRSLFGGANQAWQQSGGNHRVSFRDTFGTSGQGNSNQYKWTANQQPGQRSDNNACQQTPTLDLVNSLPKEMESWEKFHMWPFSCFSVDKDLPSLQEFYDICPEELRFEAYQAMQSANMQSYTQRVQSLQSEFASKRRQLQHMTMDLKSKLIVVIDEARKKKQTQPASANSIVFGFTQPSQHSVGQSQASGSADQFGKSSGISSGNSSGLFGKSTPGSSFGGASISDVHNSGSFGSSGPSLFGKPTGASSVFANLPQGQNFQTQSQFGLFNQNKTSDLFGQLTSQAQQTSNMFENTKDNPVSQAQSLFGQPAASSSFPIASITPATQTFGTSLSHNHPTATLFGKPITDNTTGQNLFGHQPPGQISGQNQTSVFCENSGVGQGHYTPLEDLSVHEKEAFNAKAFELGRIPIRPPPRQMIN